MAAPRVIPQRRAFVADPVLAQVDQAREDLAQVLRFCPFLRGRLVSVTLVANTTTVIRHGLGVASAFIIVRQNYDTVGARPAFTEAQPSGVDETKFLTIYADAACTVDLWCYPRASKPIDANQGQSK